MLLRVAVVPLATASDLAVVEDVVLVLLVVVELVEEFLVGVVELEDAAA